jgi:hypothetical protein
LAEWWTQKVLAEAKMSRVMCFGAIMSEVLSERVDIALVVDVENCDLCGHV